MNLTIFAERLKNRRLMRHITQAQVACLLNVTPQTVSKWERGQSAPDLDNLIEIAGLLDISVDELIRTDVRPKRTFIAIDGGGTKTEIVLFSEDGHILRRTLVGSSNINAVGADTACANLCAGINDVLAGAQPSAIFAGIAGSTIGNNAAIAKSALRQRIYGAPIEVGSDILNVIHSKRGVEACIAVICGTGSCVCAYDGKTLRRYGGWGYLFGDAGSGYDIGRDVIREYLALSDGFGKPSLVTELAAKKLGGHTAEYLSDFYSGGRDMVAAFSIIAFEAYRAGDATARGILERNMSQLASLIQAADNGSDTVIISGGLTGDRDIIEPLLRKYLPKNPSFVFPTLPQIYGAALIALKCAGCIVNEEEFDQNFTDDYHQKGHLI